MEKILIYGAGQGGRHLYEEITLADEPYEVIAFVDKKATGELFEKRIIRPEQIGNYAFDKVFVAVDDNSVKDELINKYGIIEERINVQKYLNSTAISVRIRALEHVREICDCFGIQGCTSEVGVYQGDFAKHINRVFPESDLYLYDTFDGFQEVDLAKEDETSAMRDYAHYSLTTEELVMKKMRHKKRVHICKGLFPETAQGHDRQYVFVNLDADLYAPIKAGLQFFYPRLVPGGVIFVHDYFNPGCPGVKQAIEEFIQETKIAVVPLGDYLTVAISKPMV